MKKIYLILLLLSMVNVGLSAKAHRGIHNNPKGSLWDMPPCDTPKVNPDSLLLQYYTHRPLSVTGGTPPYTYTFSPAISTSSLVALLTSTVTTVYTITVTGANGCSSTYNAMYVPLLSGSAGGSCTTIFIDQYIQDTVNHDIGLELYNPTGTPVNISSYYLMGTTNGSLSATPFFIQLHGTIGAYSTFLICNTLADTSLTHKAGMLSDSLSFGGKDIVSLAKMVVSPPNLTVSFLDMVGAITPLPTDSGWAVGSGSTKNHTLVRQASVIEGTMNWAMCQSEWNVYARGTFTYIGHYSNGCTPTDPDINLYITTPQTNCNYPHSYVTFNITASSNPSTILNNCIIDISYFGGEFAGDSVKNGGVIITRGPNFQPDTGNDYDVFDSADVMPGVAKIILGNVSDSSPYGTYLPLYHTNADTLFTVSLRIQNSCDNGYVKFTDFFNTDTAYYAIIDSQQVTEHDSDYEKICSNCISPCDSCDDGAPAIGYTSCDCADSFAWVHHDTTYYKYFSHNNSHYTTIIYAADSFSSATVCPITIFSFNDPIEAGTNHYSTAPIPAIKSNSSILYMKGMGFGSEKGSIQVSNANNYGMVSLDSIDILVWTENFIKVKMPSVLLNDSSATPGTGPIVAYNACGKATTGNILQINYNIENVHAGQQKLRPNILMQGIASRYSLVFRCDTSITHNAAAYACVKKAVREWNCWTGVNWIVGADTTLEKYTMDGISNIYFSSYNFSPTGRLMQTQQQILSCYADSVAFYNEADIEIRRNQFLPINKKWSYDTTYTQTSPDSSYFYDAILHELGHAIGLSHINDSLSLMYWKQRAGQRDSIPSQGARWPGPATLLGGWDMVNTSSAFLPRDFGCSSYIILNSDNTGCRDAKAGVPVVSKEPYNLDLFPNPINYGDLTITYDLTENSTVQFKILDCTGRVLINLSNENKPAGNYSQQVNITNLAGGVYLFTATINGEQQTIKFIKL